MSGSEPKAKISINPTVWQFLLTMAGLIAIVWSGIAFIASYTIDGKLKIFHDEVRPKLHQKIVDEIAVHDDKPSHNGVIERITTGEIHDAQVDEKLISIEQRQIDMKTKMAEDKNDLIREIRNAGGG